MAKSSEKRQGQRANACVRTVRGRDPEGHSAAQSPGSQWDLGSPARPVSAMPRRGDGGARGRCSPRCDPVPLPGSGMGWSWHTAPSCCPMGVPREVGAFVAWGSQVCRGFGQVGLESPSSPAFQAGAVVALAGPGQSKDLWSPAGVGGGCQV